MWTEMYEGHADEAEPAPAGWTDDPGEMKRRAGELFRAGDYQGARAICETLYSQGLRYPLPQNIAICCARMGDFQAAASWMAEALDDPAFPWPQPFAYSDATGRAGALEAYYHWSRNLPLG